MKCACLIPFYNESKNLKDVLEAMSSIKEIDQIICVDDASTDHSSDIVKKFFPEITLIIKDKNSGKSDAVRTGLEYVDTELVMLFDADITDVDLDEINQGIKSMKKEITDMLILRRDYAPINYFFPMDILICGERILKTNALKTIFAENFEGYAMEFEINQYFLKNNLDIKYMLCSTQNTHKTMKWGFFKGIKREIEVFYKILVRNYGLFKYNIPKQYMEIAHPRNYLHPILHHVDSNNINLDKIKNDR